MSIKEEFRLLGNKILEPKGRVRTYDSAGYICRDHRKFTRLGICVAAIRKRRAGSLLWAAAVREAQPGLLPACFSV